MKYFGMPLGMWALFSKSYRNNLDIFNIDEKEGKVVTKSSKKMYKDIIKKIPDFEKKDRFKMNIVSCAMFIAFLLNIKNKPSLDDVIKWYNQSMNTRLLHLFCKISGKSKFKNKTYVSLTKTAELKTGDRNPYSWNMEFYPYSDDSGYEVRFTKCGICHLLKEYGLFEYTKAMCELDYTMSDLGGASIFKREHTIASGGEYCDCGYYKKGN